MERISRPKASDEKHQAETLKLDIQNKFKSMSIGENLLMSVVVDYIFSKHILKRKAQ